MEPITTFLLAFWLAIQPRLIVLVALTVIDFVFGVLLALRQGRFQWSRLTGYLDSSIFPILAWMAVELIAAFPVAAIPEGVVLFIPQAIYATVFLKILASVAGHLAAIGVLTNTFRQVGVTPTGAAKPTGDGRPGIGLL